VAERAGALDGLLRHDGGARLLNDCWNNSRNTELVTGEEF
jgi:hypothetical protein